MYSVCVRACTCMCIFTGHSCMNVSMFVKGFCPLSNSLLSCSLDWRYYILSFCLLPSLIEDLALQMIPDLSVTIVITVALITMGGCNAASCRLH